MKAKTEAPSAPSFRQALALAADRLAQLQADPSTPAIPKGPALVTSCPVCHSRGYTERPEAGHLRARQLCPVCAGEGRLVTEAGGAVLELLAVALEPTLRQTAETVAEYMADDARRYEEDRARRLELAQRQAAARELAVKANQASAALLAGEEVPADLAPLVAELVDKARSGELPEQQPRVTKERQTSDPTAREQQQVTAWGSRFDRSKGAMVFDAPAGPVDEWPDEVRELHEAWLQQQAEFVREHGLHTDDDRQPELLAD
ncbi:MAG: hypothetical protein RBU45_25585 [Myxococcota bacterium]|jgi:hypothetical protein|nr:hypothetical protein [Myxococcota bacterium]